MCKHLDIYSKLLDCDIWTIRLYKFKFFQIMIPVGRLRPHFGGGGGIFYWNLKINIIVLNSSIVIGII